MDTQEETDNPDRIVAARDVKQTIVDAPVLPVRLTFLEVDRVTKNLDVNEEPLKIYLSKVASYSRESASQNFADLKFIMNLELTDARTDLRCMMDKIANDIDQKIDNDPRIDDLQRALAGLEKALGHTRTRDDELSQKLMDLQREVQEQASTDVSSIADVQRIIREFGKDRDQMSNQLEELTVKVDSSIESFTRQYEETAELSNSNSKRIDFEHGRICRTEDDINRLKQESDVLKLKTEELYSKKAENQALEEIRTEVRGLGALAEKGAEAAELVSRVACLERTRRTFDKVTEKLKTEIVLLTESEQNCKDYLAQCIASVVEVERRFDKALSDQFSSFTNRSDHLTANVQKLEVDVSSISEKTVYWDAKAEASELTSLRTAIGFCSEAFKDRENAVLFGARCLSCNRVFDDVHKEADVVDLPAEKQKACLMTGLQRALHSPRHDPMEPLSMIAVRVGRTCTARSKDGPGNFAGRNPVLMSRGVEDVQFLPLRPGTGAPLKMATVPNSARPHTMPTTDRFDRFNWTPKGKLSDYTTTITDLVKKKVDK